MMIRNVTTNGDYQISLRLNRWCNWSPAHTLFRTVSRLGDGAIWYVIIFALPVALGSEGLKTSLMLAVGALSGVGIYYAVKSLYQRPRPFVAHPDIPARATALDEWSFPSFHTLLALCFLPLFYLQMPLLFWVFLPFALLTAMSRVILGLHYTSDVVAGGTIGVLLGLTVHRLIIALLPGAVLI